MSTGTPRTSARIVLATGGTGGHVFPAQALAAELGQRGWTVAVITDRRGAAFGDEIVLHRIRAATITSSVRGIVTGGVDIGIGTLQALHLLRRLRPAAVVGFGGYPSVPTMLAARWLGLPTVLHEQNAVLGRANRLLASRVDQIATSFDRVEGIDPVMEAKVIPTGNPVRPSVATLAGQPYQTPTADGPMHILVLGGSQGARVFSEVIPQAVLALPQPLRQRLRIAQQCRSEDIENVRSAYATAGISAELATFFEDVPSRLATAHLVIARAGASTITELTAAGRPAILVPYPFATDDHQTANARAIDDAGGAWLMPQRAFCPSALAARLEAFLNLPHSLEKAAACAAAIGHPDAARRLADLVEKRLQPTGDLHRESNADLRSIAA